MVSTCIIIHIVLQKIYYVHTVFLYASSADFVRSSKELGFKMIFESAGDRVGKM